MTVAVAHELVELAHDLARAVSEHDVERLEELLASEFTLQGATAADRVQWIVDGRAVEKAGATYRWNVTRGDHRVAATVWRGGEIVARVADTDFHVK